VGEEAHVVPFLEDDVGDFGVVPWLELQRRLLELLQLHTEDHPKLGAGRMDVREGRMEGRTDGRKDGRENKHDRMDGNK
jgi:hypothetical protein